MYSGYLHDLSPYAIQFSESFGIRWYGLAYLMGFFAFYGLVLLAARRGLSVIKPEQAGDLVFIMALGTILGGRLGYCLLYSPSLFVTFTSSPPFWGVLAINQGGMASHGGVVGIVLACIYFARTRKVPALHVMDLCAVSAGIGIFFGRLANFVNGELVGREAPAGFHWGVRFPQDILAWPAYEPARLFSLSPVVEKLGVTADQWQASVQKMFGSPSAYSFVQSMLHRIVEAVQSSNIIVKNELAPLLTLRYPSQIYEALLEGLLLFVVLALIWMKPRKPGVISGFFLVVYSLVRIFGEQFRLPDLQIGYQLFGLTRGQWLSLGMFSLGVVLLIYWSRRSAEKIGGWLS